jgi:hypothetical protein
MEAVLIDVDHHLLSLSLSLLPRPLSRGGETLAAAAVAVLGRENDESPVLVAAHGSMDLTMDPKEWRGQAWRGTAWASDRIGFGTGEFTTVPLDFAVLGHLDCLIVLDVLIFSALRYRSMLWFIDYVLLVHM